MSAAYLYTEPIKFGLEEIAELDRADSYDFDIIAVWRRIEDGALLWATDSGCSCPIPFEDKGIDLQVLNEYTWPEFERAAIGDEWSRSYTPKELADFLAKAKGAMAE